MAPVSLVCPLWVSAELMIYKGFSAGGRLTFYTRVRLLCHPTLFLAGRFSFALVGLLEMHLTANNYAV